MARKYLVPIDLTQQELRNARIQNLASAPTSPSPVAGQLYFNTTDNTLYCYSGSAWVAAKTSASAFGSGESTTVSITGTAADGTSTNFARADHAHAGPGFGNVTAQTSFDASSGNGSATTVARSDHSHGTPAHDAAAHSAIRISDLDTPNADVNFGTSYKITNLADPTSAQHAATKNYVDTRKVTDLTSPTSSFSMNSQKITNLATPTADTDAANKGYVDNAVAGLSWKDSVHLLAASNVATSGSTNTLVIDGHAALTSAEDGYRILLKGQTTASDNGIYVYQDGGTTYSLVRATDADVYTELIGAAVFVKEGTAYGSTAWVQSTHYLTSFSGQVWTQFSGQGTYTASNGVALTGNDFSFAPKSDGGLDTGLAGGFIKLQTNSGLGTTSNGLAVGAGNGISVSSGTVSVDSSVVARKYAVSVGNAADTSFTVTHNLGTRDVVVQVYTVADNTQVEADVTHTSTSAVTVEFAVAPSSNQYRVVVLG